MTSTAPLAVAVAGGTGGVGRSIVKVLSTLDNLKVIVLSRKEYIALPDRAKLVMTDYSSVTSLASLLKTNQVTTVISALYDEAGEEQLRLIEAASASPCTRRFIASDWGVRFPTASVEVFPFVEWRFRAVEALKKTSLEWTRVHNGYFMDYYGRSSNMTGSPFVIDVPGNVAAIPGSGNETLALTHTHDLGRFVAALLSMEYGQWGETTYAYGERVTWNQVLAMVEEARGAQLKVSYDSIEMLQILRVTELPGHAVGESKAELLKMYALFGEYVIRGLFDVPPEQSLNAKFPDIQPIRVEEFLQMSWRPEGEQGSMSSERRALYCSPNK